MARQRPKEDRTVPDPSIPAEHVPGEAQGPGDPLVTAAFEAAPFGLAVLDRELRYVRVNEALARINGISREGHLGRRVDELLPDLSPEVTDALGRVLSTGEPVQGRVVAGQTPAEPAIDRFWRVDYYPTRDASGSVDGLVLVVNEVVDGGHLESELDRLSNRSRLLTEFYAAAVRRSNDEREILDLVAQRTADVVGDVCIIYLLHGDAIRGAAIWCRDRLQRLFAENLLPFSATLPGRLEPQAIAGERTAFLPVLNDAERAHLLETAVPAVRPFLERYPVLGLIRVPLRIGGRVVGTVELLRTDRSRPPYDWRDVDMLEGLALRASLVLEAGRAQRAAAATAARLESVLTESPVATVLLDANLHVQLWNRAAEELFGWTEAELRGQPLPIAPPDLTDEIAEIRRRTLAGEAIRGLETRRLRRDGSVVEVAVYDAPYRGPDGKPIGIVLRMIEIGERKRLEQDLQQTSATLRAILDASPLAVIAVDRDVRVIFWSHGAERLYGWRADEVLGREPPIEPPETPDALRGALRRIFAGHTVDNDDTRRITRSGEVISVRSVTAPLRDENGEITGALAIHEDTRERRKLESELFEARKMESIGRLAGGIAHDFNNILTAIIGFADLALSEPPGSDVRSSIATIKGSAERAAGLTQQLLAFSRRQMLQPQILDANEIVLRMEAMLRRLIGERIELAISVTPNVGSLRADRTQLEQVILNLALNARDAMPAGGRLAIRTEHTRFDETSLSRHFEVTPGDYVLISVTDTGVGMDEATRAQIFEPFFTTKPPERGTGLGLATTYGIVKQSGGYIWVYSEPGQGTTFKLYFPAIRDAADEERLAPLAPGTRTGRILLVEDEPVLRELARQVLRRRGFEVLVAANAREAIEIVERHAEEPIDLLVSDVVMPGSSGTELATRLRAARPELRVLLMSGYAEEIVSAAELPGATRPSFLAKPFTPDALVRSVDEALASAPRPQPLPVRPARRRR